MHSIIFMRRFIAANICPFTGQIFNHISGCFICIVLAAIKKKIQLYLFALCAGAGILLECLVRTRCACQIITA
jgi:hypothetical protein